MSSPPLTRRVEILEETVQELQKLPDRMDRFELQLLQFREEVRAEFSATRSSINERTDERIGELRRHMLMLHEDLIARISLIQEGRPPRRRKS